MPGNRVYIQSIFPSCFTLEKTLTLPGPVLGPASIHGHQISAEDPGFVG